MVLLADIVGNLTFSPTWESCDFTSAFVNGAFYGCLRPPRKVLAFIRYFRGFHDLYMGKKLQIIGVESYCFPALKHHIRGDFYSRGMENYFDVYRDQKFIVTPADLPKDYFPVWVTRISSEEHLFWEKMFFIRPFSALLSLFLERKFSLLDLTFNLGKEDLLGFLVNFAFST